MIAGMDFGTTHSGMAIYDGQQLRTIPLNVASSTERVTPTILYITHEQKIWFGREAINAYFEQNLGRPSKLERVWVGEITQTFAELPTFVKDVYIWVDVLSPGRLFLSFKTDLSDAAYTGTAIGRFFYTLEDIAATYLYIAKRRAEQVLGHELHELVLGRPVRFNADPEADQLAQARLLEAAWQAGYEKVYFEYEPIAAAYYYETTLRQPQNVLVFDFGGGTLDVTIMRLGDPRQRQVLATGGVPIAGDVFDRKIVRAKIPKLFGEGSLYRSMNKKLPIPPWIYDSFGDWRTILALQEPEAMQTLRMVLPGAERKRELEALIKLVASNYSLKLFETVERVKRQLSERDEAVIRLEGEGFNLRVPITRVEFERLIRPEYNIIEQHVDETLQRSGLRASEIDVVIRTGGSSQIPMFQRMLGQKFGAEKVQALDIFGSVTAGLGVIGQRIASGELALKGYARPAQWRRTTATERTKVPPVNLDLVKQQIARQEGATQPTTSCALLLLSKNYELALVEQPATLFASLQTLPLADLGLPGQAALALVQATLDEPLLLLTSTYRLLLVTARDLLHYQNAQLEFTRVHSFERGEQLCLVQRWATVRDQPQLLIISTQGYARRFDMAQLRPTIEGPSLAKIGWALPGWPRVVVGAEESQDLLLINDQGRAIRLPVAAIKRAGSRVYPKQKGDEIVGGGALPTGEEVWLLTTEGYTKWLAVEQTPLTSEGNPPGVVVVRRRGEICGVVTQFDKPLWVLTATRLVALDPQRTPHDPVGALTMHSSLKLAAGERICGVLHTA